MESPKKKKQKKVKQYPRMYPCTQQNIITLAGRAWQYCLELIAAFTAVSPSIDAAFVAAQNAKVEAADLLPNNTQRKDGHVSAHVELVEANAAVCRAWQMLKTFIKRAFPKSLYSIKLEAAGNQYYTDAKGGKFDFTASLITDAKAFMTTYATELTADGIMSPDFPTEFGNLATAFSAERTVFQNKLEQAGAGTSLKDKAIRENVEEPLSTLFALGKQIYYNDPVNLKKFTYEDLIMEVRGNDPAGLKGLIIDGTNGKPLLGVEASNGTVSMLTEKNGKYLLRMASGPHSFTFKKAGYEDVVLLDKEIKVGTTSIYNVSMVAIPSEAAANPAEPDAGMAEQDGAGEDTPQPTN
ncbi:MAG: hypothetical protein GC192_09180 [Bacteroidetes bacterium]|nr:hypothetical protein [Bacteroidota bacterium]